VVDCQRLSAMQGLSSKGNVIMMMTTILGI